MVVLGWAKGYEGMYTHCVAVLALVGCGGAAPVAPTAATAHATAPKLTAVACPSGTTSLTGVVVDESGSKVHSFGVVTAIDYSFTGVYPKAEQFTSRDGSFRTCAPTRDRVDVIIVGLDFARTTIPGVSTTGSQASIGTVVVKPGMPVTGIVQTEDGTAVGNATVRIVQSRWANDLFTNLAMGNFETHTDEHGRFSFANYRKQLLGYGGRIFASTQDNAVSPKYVIRDGAGSMTLTIAPAGTLELIVSGAQDGDIVGVSSLTGGYADQLLRGGHATFHGLAPGSYVVTLVSVRSVEQAERAAGSNADPDARIAAMQPTQLGVVNVAAGSQANVSLTYSAPSSATP